MRRFELPIYQITGALRISGKKENDGLTVFLDLARAFPGKERIIQSVWYFRKRGVILRLEGSEGIIIPEKIQ